VGPVYGYPELLEDPQVRHNGSFVTYDHPTEGTVTARCFPRKFSKTSPAVGRPAPLTGVHTDEVLSQLGYEAEVIDRLLSEGVIRHHRCSASSSR
jgi:crotonobetainyl-CoA:carnitine CoA-transferase CaiB-like acyl-CoA transferase